MINKLILLAITLLLFGCAENQKQTDNSADSQKDVNSINLTTEIIKINMKEGSCAQNDTSSCAELNGFFPIYQYANHENSESLKSLNESVYKIFITSFQNFIDDAPIHTQTTIDELKNAFHQKFLKDKAKFNERVNYLLSSEVKEVYRNENYISFKHFEMSYEGGAHPNSFTRYHTLNPKNGETIDVIDWLKDTVEVKNKILTELKNRANISLNQDIEEGGYFISDKNFFVSNQILFSKDSVHFLYNPYDIAAYSKGAIEVVFPKNEISVKN